ncbi:hypothetical protein ACFXTN_017404 [Malus domestica]
MSKGTSTISEYLQRIKEVSDALAAAGTPVEESDLLHLILNGLPDDYDSFVDSIQFRLADTTVDDLHGFLLSKEMALARRKPSHGSSEPYQAFTSIPAASNAPHLLPTPPPHQAYNAQSNGSQNYYPSNNRGNFQRNTSQRPYNNRNRSNRFNNSSTNRGGNRGGNRGFRSFTSAVIPCQIF